MSGTPSPRCWTQLLRRCQGSSGARVCPGYNPGSGHSSFAASGHRPWDPLGSVAAGQGHTVNGGPSSVLPLRLWVICGPVRLLGLWTVGETLVWNDGPPHPRPQRPVFVPVSPVLPGHSVGKESACSAGDIGDRRLIPGPGRSPGEGSGSPLQCSCLENPMDRGAWWATVHGVPKSWTQLKRLSNNSYFINKEEELQRS